MATPLGDLGILEPLLVSIQNMFGTLKYLIGGVFGIYVLLLIWRIIETRMSQKTLTQILEEIQLNNRLLRRIERHQEMKVRKK